LYPPEPTQKEITEALKVFKLARICMWWNEDACIIENKKNGLVTGKFRYGHCNSKHARCRYCRGETKSIGEGWKDFDGTCETCHFCDSDEQKQKCPYFKNPELYKP
jgi:hypothetical protein